MPAKPHCCFIPCKAAADWEIRYGNTPDDYTHSCTPHVGEMLEAEQENAVYPIEMAA